MLPREAVAAPSLAMFKARLNGALSNLISWKVSLPVAGGWNDIIYKVSSNPNHSMICYMLKWMPFSLRCISSNRNSGAMFFICSWHSSWWQTDLSFGRSLEISLSSPQWSKRGSFSPALSWCLTMQSLPLAEIQQN